MKKHKCLERIIWRRPFVLLDVKNKTAMNSYSDMFWQVTPIILLIKKKNDLLYKITQTVHIHLRRYDILLIKKCQTVLCTSMSIKLKNKVYSRRTSYCETRLKGERMLLYSRQIYVHLLFY